MFFSSALVPRLASPAGRIDTFASTRSEPSSMFTSETPIRRSVAWSRRPNSAASAASRRSGSVTISTSGVPPRLKSTMLVCAPWIRPELPACTSLAASSSRWTRWMRTSPSRPFRASGMSYWLIW
jgi:hypothetical protein